MTVGTLILIILAGAAALTLAMGLTRKHKNLLMTFLQNFCGVLFLISGAVKAVDPLGTAYKMDQYFGEFYGTFQDTAMSFIAPLFPFLSNYSVGFAVVMIVLEIVVGAMLIIGYKNKLTAWIFFLTVAFFTVLTGFTFLTGYVPSGTNFFAFSEWGEYQKTNMRVTDCGCFGDFLKLEPRTSFLKDIVLLAPSILFLLFYNKMHQLWSKALRTVLTGVVTVGTIWYCLSNFAWDIPSVDFRPFKEGVDIAKQKELEEEAMANVPILGYQLTNKETGKSVSLSYDEYISNFKKYPKDEWEASRQMGEPEVEPTKISDFLIEDINGYDVTEDILTQDGYAFMIVAHKLYATGEQKTRKEFIPALQVNLADVDIDTADPERARAIMDSLRILADSTIQKEVSVTEYTWKESYIDDWTEVDRFLEEAQEIGVDAFAVVGGASPDMIKSLQTETDFQFPVYQADDILLKTIVRSNPGIVLMRKGTIIKKWHKSKLPKFEEVRSAHISR